MYTSFVEINAGSGNIEPIKTERFSGTDHPEVAAYLKGDHGHIVQVPTDSILDTWVDMPVYSKNFGDCLPLIALKDNKAQMIHRGVGLISGYDFGAFTDKVNNHLSDWQKAGAKVSVLKADRTRHLDTSLVEVKRLFGNNFQFIDFKMNSMFDIIVDPKSNLLLVQFKSGEFRKYNI